MRLKPSIETQFSIVHYAITIPIMAWLLTVILYVWIVTLGKPNAKYIKHLNSVVDRAIAFRGNIRIYKYYKDRARLFDILRG